MKKNMENGKSEGKDSTITLSCFIYICNCRIFCPEERNENCMLGMPNHGLGY